MISEMQAFAYVVRDALRRVEEPAKITGFSDVMEAGFTVTLADGKRFRVDVYEEPESSEPKKARPLTPADAPRWNCVDYPGDGMHYLNKKGGCHWCEMTKEQIAHARQVHETTHVIRSTDDDDHFIPAPLVGEVVRWIDRDTVLVQWPGENTPTREAMDELTPYKV